MTEDKIKLLHNLFWQLLKFEGLDIAFHDNFRAENTVLFFSWCSKHDPDDWVASAFPWGGEDRWIDFDQKWTHVLDILNI